MQLHHIVSSPGVGPKSSRSAAIRSPRMQQELDEPREPKMYLKVGMHLKLHRDP